MLLISNVGSTKVLYLGPFTFDGGTLLFPLAYVLGDIITEVYGYARSRRVIWTGFIWLAVTAVTLAVIDLLPPAADGKMLRLLDIAIPVFGANNALRGVLCAHLDAGLVHIAADRFLERRGRERQYEIIVVSRNNKVLYGPKELEGKTLDPALLVDDTVTLPIQINGKRRAEISVPKDMPGPEVEKIALANEDVLRFLAGQPVKKIIVVPGRIINVVV